MSGRVALMERFAKAAETGGRRSPIFYDDEVIGFGLQVRDNGRKTFTQRLQRTTPPAPPGLRGREWRLETSVKGLGFVKTCV